MRAINEVNDDDVQQTARDYGEDSHRHDNVKYEAIEQAKIGHWYTVKRNLIDFNYLFNI